MKRNILILIMMLMLPLGMMKAQGLTYDECKEHIARIEEYGAKGYGISESHIRSIARAKIKEVDYAYISTNMFRQMFSMIDGSVEINGNFIGSLKSIRRFASTGKNGYEKLKAYMFPFFDEQIFDMEIMMLNRNGEMLSMVYSDDTNLLVINDDGNTELIVVYIAGMSYDMFLKIQNVSGGIRLNF
mgnify:FL=1